MEDWNPNKLLSKAVFINAAILVSSLSMPVKAVDNDAATRGLKSRVPVKPQFDEPVYDKPEQAPLELETVLPEEKVEPSTSDDISSAPQFHVDKIIVSGSTIFSQSELAGMLAPYEGRTVTVDELQSLRHNLSLAYFQRGYVNSGVVITNQDDKSGTIKFSVIEGQLSKLNLRGNERLKDDYILERINLGVKKPLNVNDLQNALRNIQRNKLIKKINAQLKPSADLGVAELDVEVTEEKFQSLSVALDNYRSPSIGAEEIILSYTNRNLLGIGDALGVSYSKTEGLDSVSLNYTVPITAEETTLSVFYSQSESEVVEKPFDDLDIEYDSNDFGFNLSTPIYKDNQTTVSLITGMMFKESESFLLGEPFEFSAGSEDGMIKSRALEIGGSYVYRASAEVYAVSLTARQGLDIMDANESSDDDIPDSKFLSFLGQGQYARRVESIPGSQFILRSAFQLSMDPLLPIEKLSVGGHSSVRGYRENQLVRDNGLTASAEFRYALFADKSGNDPYNFQLVPFLDWGSAWNEDVPSQDDETVNVYSAGLGFLWQPINGLNVDAFWGEALGDDRSNGRDDLQDDGIHFSISYSKSF